MRFEQHDHQGRLIEVFWRDDPSGQPTIRPKGHVFLYDINGVYSKMMIREAIRYTGQTTLTRTA